MKPELLYESRPRQSPDKSDLDFALNLRGQNFKTAIRETFNKKTVKLENSSQIARDPPTIANLGILNYKFFIAFLALIDHEMDFEINLFFSFTKMA